MKQEGQQIVSVKVLLKSAVCARLRLSGRELDNLIDAGKFPSGRIPKPARVWLESEIDGFEQELDDRELLAGIQHAQSAA